MTRQPTLVDVTLIINNLLSERRPDLILCPAGRYYEPKLLEVKSGLDKLPRALTGGLAVAADLASADMSHDGHGAVIWFVTETVLRNPLANAEDRAAAQHIREAFLPALAELKDSYAVEAHRALERKPLLASMRADLSRFPVPGSKSLFETASEYVAAGERLNALLDERGSVPQRDRSNAAILRAKAAGLLTRLRKDLREDLDKDPTLPRDLEHRVFGYADTLMAMKRSSTSTDAEVAAPPAP
jgi:hypothetical protein